MVKVSPEELQAHINRIPINACLHLQLLEIAKGYCRLMMPFNPTLTNTWNTTHGGALMTITDIAAFIALATRNGLDISGRVSTIEQKTNFLNPSKESDLYAEARIIKMGRRVVFAEVQVTDSSQRPVTYSTVTFMRS